MPNEVTHNHVSGKNLYACRFQLDGDVFLTDGASDEVWGTGGRTATDYDVAMTEEATSGHYKCDFDAGGNIGAGVYQVTVYVRDGADPPANGDVILAQGEIYWDGTAEINASTITAIANSIITEVNANEIKIDAILTDTGTDGVVLKAAGLSVDAVDKILDEIIEGSTTFRQFCRLALAVLTGKSSGGGTTKLTFRSIDDTKDRLQVTVDSYGNRVSVEKRDGT